MYLNKLGDKYDSGKLRILTRLCLQIAQLLLEFDAEITSENSRSLLASIVENELDVLDQSPDFNIFEHYGVLLELAKKMMLEGLLFATMFLVFLLGFALSFHLLFGNIEVGPFKTLFSAVFSLFSMITGDFDWGKKCSIEAAKCFLN